MLYISLRQYEYVCAIGRYGSLSAASHHLNVSQPALSTALTRVESHLGYPLFIRRRGAAMALTPQGRRFIERAEDVLTSAARIEASDTAEQGLTQLRLGCFTDLAPFHLASALRHLQASLPNVTTAYTVGPFESLLSDLINGQLDIAITYDLGMDAGFSRTTLFENRAGAILSPDHALAKRKQVTLSELEDYPLILSNEGLSAQHILALFRLNGLSPRVAHRAASLEIQRSLAAHGEGVGISYANPPGDLSYDNKPLVRLPISNPDATEAIVLARHGKGPTDATLAMAERVLIVNLTAERAIASGVDG